MNKLFLIDASNYLFRSYFAIKGMTNKQGLATNALFGFVRSIQKLLTDFSPQYMAIVFDGPDNKSSRIKIYKEYKGHREKMPDDLYAQIALAKKYCNLKGLAIVEKGGVEADDSIGSIAYWAQDHDFETYLCSTDKDLCQLVNPKTFILNTFKDNLVLKKPQVVEKFGVKPEQIIDYLAIVGDSSDNIPGISGFGPKKAQTLLCTFNTLNHIYENLHKIENEKMRQKLIEEKKSALISQQLATIDLDVPIEKKKEFYKIQNENEKDLTSFFQEMNFNYFLRQMPSFTTQHVQSSIEKINVVNNEQDFSTLLKSIKKKNELVVSTFCDVGNIMLVEPIAIALDDHYIDCQSDLSLKSIVNGLNTLFSSGLALISHNCKKTLHALKNIGINPPNISFDTQIASYLLNTEKTSHPLELLCQEFLNKPIKSFDELLGKGKSKKNLHELDLQSKAQYCLEMNLAIGSLKTLFTQDLKKRDLNKLYFDIELKLIKVLFDMERNGIGLCITKLETLKLHVDQKLKVLEKKIYHLAGKEFNISSPKQLSHILFIDLCITPVGKKTQSGYSTNADVLQALKDKHAIIENLIEFRTLNKLKTTYIDVLPKQVNHTTHRIHPTFNQAIAQTGRLACSEPNLQNIPIRSELGREIRKAFIAKKDHSFISLDYSQIELRILAHLSQDPTLLKAFKTNQDIHTQTAALIYNCLEEQVTKTMRSNAKVINFGILYGQGPFGLAKELSISTKEASHFIKSYFEKFSGVKAFIDECIQDAKKQNRSLSIMQRERKIPQINSSNHILQSLGKRLAVNSPIQGSQADIIKLAMINIQNYLLKHPNCVLVLQIHDELIFECLDSEVENHAKKLKSLMQNVLELDVPLTVDSSVAKNLGAC